ncbi:peptidase inhibitor family I36 protein [Streptomyces zhihengii]|uniref:peptidase inhibitor family I36 protein n=1 Tax=Streptomyces zhihengii TaxID=1818004 RepID=UPI0033A32F6C
MSLKKLAYAAGVSLAAVAISGATAFPAQAAGQINICVNINYGGGCLTTSSNVADSTRLGLFWRDSISSLRNWSGADICFYEHAGYTGAVMWVGKGVEVANTHNYGMGDTISSWRPC